jgi:superfamily II DNA/RNA helicase
MITAPRYGRRVAELEGRGAARRGLVRRSARSRALQGLVVVPTRELAIQVASVARELCSLTSRRRAAPIQVGKEIQIWTPRRSALTELDVSTLRFVVLDEVDHLLHNYSVKEVMRLLQRLDRLREKTHRLVFTSATLDRPVLELAHKFMRDPLDLGPRSPNATAIAAALLGCPESEIAEQPEERPLQRVGQYALPPNVQHTLFIASGDRLKHWRQISRMHASFKPRSALVFVGSIESATSLREELDSKTTLRSCVLDTYAHNKERTQRKQTMELLQKGQYDLIFSTEHAARGLDMPVVSHVFNYDVPSSAEHYVHRAGRVGRLLRGTDREWSIGRVVTLVHDDKDRARMNKIASELGILFEECQQPAKGAGPRPAQVVEAALAGQVSEVV